MKVRKQLTLDPENVKRGEKKVLQIRWNGATSYNFSRLIDDYLKSIEL
jgi:glutamyl/glutaminyl-tRNA synthetase